MKFTIFYFSGTGNTKWAVKQLDKILNNNGHSSAYYPIEDIVSDKKIIELSKDTDYIGFAYPIYLQNMPRIMRNFLSRFTKTAVKNNLTDKKIFFINTHGYVNAYSVFRAKKIISASTFDTIGFINIKLTDNTKPNENKYLVGDALPDNYKSKVIDKLNSFVNKIERKKHYINGIGPHIIIGRILSSKFNHIVEDSYKNMHIDIDKCTKCMNCINNCPTKSIQYNDEKFTFYKTCEACMRCICNCPANAISNKSIK